MLYANMKFVHYTSLLHGVYITPDIKLTQRKRKPVVQHSCPVSASGHVIYNDASFEKGNLFLNQ